MFRFELYTNLPETRVVFNCSKLVKQISYQTSFYEDKATNGPLASACANTCGGDHVPSRFVKKAPNHDAYTRIERFRANSKVSITSCVKLLLVTDVFRNRHIHKTNVKGRIMSH